MSDWSEFFLTLAGAAAYAAFASGVVAMALHEARRNGRASLKVSRSSNPNGGDHGC